MPDNEKTSPQYQHFMQSSVMFGGLAILLKEIAPERTKEILESAQKHCKENGYGDDIPRSVLNSLYGKES